MTSLCITWLIIIPQLIIKLSNAAIKAFTIKSAHWIKWLHFIFLFVTESTVLNIFLFLILKAFLCSVIIPILISSWMNTKWLEILIYLRIFKLRILLFLSWPSTAVRKLLSIGTSNIIPSYLINCLRLTKRNIYQNFLWGIYQIWR